ncbi:MAG: protein translocase subunit SecD [Candidatus Ancillula sp.]|jgi:preprotein translocase subunit SecD|nr:protein translocase subunit SecD [Candidatus Ancillula sp.]
MAVKNSAKAQHPVRTLVTLFIIIFLIYGIIGFNVVQLHWDELTAPKTEEPAPDQSTDESSDQSPDATADQSADVSTDPNATPEASTPGDESASNGEGDENATPEANDAGDGANQVNSEDNNVSDSPKTPDAVGFIPKFALDLAGGTQIILSPVVEGDYQIDENALSQAIEVIRQRIDASGVSEAEINQQGNSNIVVGIPGETPSDETIKLISNAAKMRFRPVITAGAPTANFYSAALGQKSALANQEGDQELMQQADKNGDGSIDEEESKGYIEAAAAKDKATFETERASDTASGTSKYSEITDEDIAAFDAMDCSKEENRKGGGNDDSSKPLVSCQQDGSYKYMLSSVAVEGDGIDKAQAGLKPLQNGRTSNEWVVSLQFKDKADDDFIAISEQIKKLSEPRNQFAIVLDGLVISAPSIQPDTTFVKGNGVEISSGSAQSEGMAKTREWSTTLANQLSFGALPMSFNVDSKEQVSASLGSEQLQKGLLAGLLGLLLVVIYSLFQYRALGLVTVGSLGVAALLTYGVLLLLSWQIGYRLSLPGIIGLIVAIGITADSFIVYFERIRDELRDGRSLDMAVARGWKRALQTILASDTVNILAAVVLYMLAVGGVRGFAFTLGLTTLIDLAVVYMFTHPAVILLSKIRFFRNGHPLSGLSAFNLGADNAERYRAMTSKEKQELRDQRKLEDKLEKEQRLEARSKAKQAKVSKRESKLEARIQAKEHEALMEKKLNVLKSGGSEEDILDVTLTIAERKALAKGKDISKLQAIISDEGEADDGVADTTKKDAPKKSEQKKPATKKTSKGATKSTAKPATKKSSSKTTATAKTPAKMTAKKPAAKTSTKPSAKSSTKSSAKSSTKASATSAAAKKMTTKATPKKAPAKPTPKKITPKKATAASTAPAKTSKKENSK